MNNTNRHIKIARLIYKQRLSKLSLHELGDINEWMSENENNKITYQKLIDSDTETILNKYNSIDVEDQWNTFNKKVNKRFVFKYIKQSLSIAASVILLMGVAFFVLQNRYQASEYVEYANVQSKSIQLIMSDGLVVDLNKSGNTVLSNDVNHSITNVGKKIVYQSKKVNDNLFVKPKMNKLIIPKGSFYNVVLSDGTKVWLNSQTKFSYPVAFSGKTREVTLEGEGYFEVFPDKKKPFIVKMNKINVKVLGTVFNVNTHAENGEISTALLSGSVEIYSKTAKCIIKPGEVAKCINNKINVEKTDILPYIAWKEGMFCFRNESLKSILKCLERSYDVEFVFTKQIDDEYFTGDISRDKPIEAVLSVIDMLTMVNFEKRGNKVFIN